MALAELISTPQTPTQFQSWAFANQAHHRDIIARISATKGVTLQELDAGTLNPDDPSSFAAFLINNSTMHMQMDAALGVAQNNLATVDWQDQAAVAQWIFLHAQEHIRAAQLLGVA